VTRSVPYDAVTFDFWNTLLVPQRVEHTSDARSASMLAALAEDGFPVTRDDLDRAFVDLFEIFNEHWAENRQFTSREASSVVLERLGASLDADAAERVHAAFGDAASGIVPSLAPNVGEVLVALRERGLRIGIICDVGMTPSTVLRRYLDGYGLLEHFDHWSFSDEVGVYKPHREIFDHALAGLGGLAPGRVAHVGDLRRTDVAGARALGITAVRYRAVHDDAEPDDGSEVVEGDHVIDDHLDLLAALDLG
jgi:putative hydrolase of the HAD superfamily